MTRINLPPAPPLPTQRQAEQLYRTLWETTTDAVLIMDTASNILFASPASLTVLGYLPEQLVGQNLAIVQPERLRAAHRRGLQHYLDSGVRKFDWRAVEVVALRPGGIEVPVEIAFSDIDLDGQRLFVGFFRDIAERRKSQEALFAEKERAQITLQSIADGVISTDIRGHVTFLNAMAETMTGWRQSDAVGRSCREVLCLLEEGSRAPLPDSISLAISNGITLQFGGRTLQLRRDGGEFSVEGSVAPISDGDHRVVGTVIAFRDVSLARKLAAEIRHQASHDSLTGLVNRSEFDRKLRAALETASLDSTSHSLLYLDLDQFKVVNDTCGHIAGDELLRQVSSILKLHLRERDTLARLGGDEFGVLLEGCPPDSALRVADKLRQSIADFTFVWQDKAFTVGVSIGQVNFQDGGLTPIEILSTADAACYIAKDEGRNRIHTYQPEDQALAKRHGEMEWIGRINKAMDQQRLCLYAQPIFDLKHGHVLHQEVLLRMRDVDGRIVLPMAFIPAAERYNLMPAVDRWVIRTMLAHIAGLAEAPGHGYAINLSGTSLTDDQFLEFVRAQFADTGVAPALICFEITETVAIANLAKAAKLIAELKALGCSISLDDFGSGMSSFAYLKHLPVDFLKIDGSFVRDLVHDPIDRAMVESINHIGHVMGLRTIAEFAENEAIVQRLRAIGVDYAQGYGLAEPAFLV